jgi:polysaccharide export outer membrane protein
MHLKMLCLGGAMLILAGCGSSDIGTQSATQIIRSGSRSLQDEALRDDYIIRKADLVAIDVFGYDEFKTETTVKEIGTIAVPLIGDVMAAGLTKEQLRAALTAKFAEYIQGNIQFTLTVTSSLPKKVVVIGAVTRQDNYPLTDEVSLLEVISMAGGVTAESDLRAVKILRGGLDVTPIEIDVAYYVEQGIVTSMPMVRPGDTVYVPRAENVIRDLSRFMTDVIFLFGFFSLFN